MGETRELGGKIPSLITNEKLIRGQVARVQPPLYTLADSNLVYIFRKGIELGKTLVSNIAIAVNSMILLQN